MMENIKEQVRLALENDAFVLAGEVLGLRERVRELMEENEELKVDNTGLRNGAFLNINRIKVLEDANTSIKKECFEKHKRITELEKENEELKVTIKALIEENSELVAQNMGDGYCTQCKWKGEKMLALEIELQSAREVINELSNEKAKINEELGAVCGEVAELKKANEELRNRLMEEGYCAQCEWMEGEMLDMEARLDEVNAKNAELEKENKMLRIQLNEWVQDKMDAKCVELVEVEEKLDKAVEKIAKLTHTIERKDDYIEKIRHENDLLESKCRLRESDLKCLEKMFFELDEELVKTKKELKKEQSKLGPVFVRQEDPYGLSIYIRDKDTLVDKKEYDKVVEQRDKLLNIFKDALIIGEKHD